jgi:hypothetical protein
LSCGMKRSTNPTDREGRPRRGHGSNPSPLPLSLEMVVDKRLQVKIATDEKNAKRGNSSKAGDPPKLLNNP